MLFYKKKMDDFLFDFPQTDRLIQDVQKAIARTKEIGNKEFSIVEYGDPSKLDEMELRIALVCDVLNAFNIPYEWDLWLSDYEEELVACFDCNV